MTPELAAQQDAARRGAMNQLAHILRIIETNDPSWLYPAASYEFRNRMVNHAVTLAMELGYPAGYAIDTSEVAWLVAYIELPSGQVSWHIPAHTRTWDGHTTAEKYQRCEAYRTGVWS